MYKGKKVIAVTGGLNEEGKLLDEPRRNWKADVVCPSHGGDWTAGDVAFTGGNGPDGETLGLTEAQAAELRRIDRIVRVMLVRADGCLALVS